MSSPKILSSARAPAMALPSSFVGAITCRPTGSLSFVKPQGSEIAGTPQSVGP